MLCKREISSVLPSVARGRCSGSHLHFCVAGATRTRARLTSWVDTGQPAFARFDRPVEVMRLQKSRWVGQEEFLEPAQVNGDRRHMPAWSNRQ